MKPKLILFAALMLLGINAAAQSAKGRISGIVVDEVEDFPMTGATIVVKELKIGEIADLDGKFSFQAPPAAKRPPALAGGLFYCPSGRYSRISPTLQSSTRQIVSSVLTRIARTLPVLRMDMFDRVMPTSSASSLSVIFRFASMTSRLTTIIGYTMNAWSSSIVRPFAKICAKNRSAKPSTSG